jgi:hypothetical protein
VRVGRAVAVASPALCERIPPSPSASDDEGEQDEDEEKGPASWHELLPAHVSDSNMNLNSNSASAGQQGHTGRVGGWWGGGEGPMAGVGVPGVGWRGGRRMGAACMHGVPHA